MPVHGHLYYVRKIGGLWFVRVGRWQFSFCKCRDHRLEWSPPQIGEVLMIEDITLRQIRECQQ